MLKALQTSFKSFTTAILCQKCRNRDTISTKTQRRRRSGKYSGEELCCAPVGHTQRAAQDADEARQAANPSRKQQEPGNKPQSSKPPRSARHSRQRTNTDPQQPASARPNPSQNLTALAPLAQTGPTTSATLARISLARRTVSACIGSRQPIIARANEALLAQHRRNPFIQLQ